MSDQDEIRDVLEGIISGKSGAEMASYYAPEAMVWDVMPSEARGRKAIEESFDHIMVDMKDLRGEIRRLEVDVEGSHASACSIQHFTWESRATGQTGEILFRQSDVLKKINGRWQVTRQHISIPIDVQTGQAVWTFE